MEETKLAMLQYEFRANLERTAKIVSVLDADLGMQLDVAGEKLFLVDEQGQILDDTTAAAVMMELALQNHRHSSVIGPITLPNGFDTIAGWRDSRFVRISNNLQSIMEAANSQEHLLGVDGSGSFVFPAFQPAVDGMMAAAKLLEYLATYRANISHTRTQISEIVSYLPQSHVAEARAYCATGAKGAIMRLLNEQHGVRNSDGNVEGIKIALQNPEWVHIAPDPDSPYFTIIAEAATWTRAGELTEQYRAYVEGLQPAAVSEATTPDTSPS
jgi:phosphomannomutase